MTTEALVPAAAEPAVATGGAGEIVLPQVIVDAGPSAVARFLEFFAGRIANARTRAAYGRAVRVVCGRGRNPTFSPPRVTVLRLQDAKTFWPCSRSWP